MKQSTRAILKCSMIALGVALIGLGMSAPALAHPAFNTPEDCQSVEIIRPDRAPFDDRTPGQIAPVLEGFEFGCILDYDGANPEAEEADFGLRSRLLIRDGAAFADFREIVTALDADGWEFAGGSTTTASPDGGDFAAIQSIDELLLVEGADDVIGSFFAVGDESSQDSIDVEYMRSAAESGLLNEFPFYIADPDVPLAPGEFPEFTDEDLSLMLTNAQTSVLVLQVNDRAPLNDVAEAVPPTSDFGFDDPSVMSGLNTIAETVTPAQVGFAAGGAVVLGLLMTFPSRLLSDAKSRVVPKIVARLKAWWGKRRGGTPKPVAPKPEPKRHSGWPLALAGLFVASILTVFVDPRAGFDSGTLRLFGSVFAAFVFDVGIGWLGLTLLVSRLVPAAVPRLQFKPWTFVLVVAAVFFTRAFGLEPGLTVGLVAGVVFGGVLAAQHRVRLTLTVVAYGFVLSILAWVGYSALAGVLGPEPDGWAIFLQETLAAITVAGIVALPLALLPIRGFAGYDLFTQSRPAWAIAYGIGLAGFLLILVPFPTSWKEVPYSFLAWLGLFIGYVVVAVAAWLIVVKPWKPESAEDAALRAAREIEVSHR